MPLMTDQAKASFRLPALRNMVVSLFIGVSLIALRHPTQVIHAFSPYVPKAEAASAPTPAVVKNSRIPSYLVSPETLDQIINSGLYRVNITPKQIVPDGFVFTVYTNNGRALTLMVRDTICDTKDCYLIVSVEGQDND